MKKALIIGNGFMGGSLGMALTNTGKYLVSFYDKNPKLSTINTQHHLEYFENKDIMDDFDIIFNATGDIKPLALYRPEPFARPVINIASVQMPFDTRTGYFQDPSFNYYRNPYKQHIFCHPICGSEKSGRDNAKADVYQGKDCIITKEWRNVEIVDFATECFKDIGMNVFYCDTAKEHNENMAITSHLLHYLAFNGFQDLHPVFNRLANSNREMWEGIFLANKQNIDNAMLKFSRAILQTSTTQQHLSEYGIKSYTLDIQCIFRTLTCNIPEEFYGTALKEYIKKTL